MVVLSFKPCCVYVILEPFLHPPGEKVYLPLGGGIQHQFTLGPKLELNAGVQLFHNVIRPTKGTVDDLRFLIEFVFL